MARLTTTRDGASRATDVDANLVVVGSDATCTLRIEGPDVSPVHCELRRGPEGWRVVDLESRTGTKVNGEFVNTRALRAGDVVAVGGFEIRVEDAGAPAAPQAAPRAVPARAAVPAAPRTARAPAPRTARAAGGGAEPTPAERRRGLERKSDRATVGLYVGVGIVAIFLVGFLLFKSVSSETHNHRVRIRMLDAEKRMDFKGVLAIAREAEPEQSFDRTEIDAIVVRAQRALEAEKTGHRIDESIRDWQWIRAWRQENKAADAEYVAKIDEFLRKFPGMDSEGLKQARAERVRLTGTAAIGGVNEGGEAGWASLLVDVQAMEAEGRFGASIAKIDDWWAKNRDAAPALAAKVEAEKARLAAAAEKWFAKQVALAIHYVGNGERKRAQRTIEQAAETIGLPGYRERVPAEVTRVLGN